MFTRKKTKLWLCVCRGTPERAERPERLQDGSAADGCGWLRMAADGCGWLQMRAAYGCGWLWKVSGAADGCGWLRKVSQDHWRFCEVRDMNLGCRATDCS